MCRLRWNSGSALPCRCFRPNRLNSRENASWATTSMRNSSWYDDRKHPVIVRVTYCVVSSNGRRGSMSSYKRYCPRQQLHLRSACSYSSCPVAFVQCIRSRRSAQSLLQARSHRRNISSDSTRSQGEVSSGSSESDDIQFDLGLSENKKVCHLVQHLPCGVFFMRVCVFLLLLFLFLCCLFVSFYCVLPIVALSLRIFLTLPLAGHR